MHIDKGNGQLIIARQIRTPVQVIGPTTVPRRTAVPVRAVLTTAPQG